MADEKPDYLKQMEKGGPIKSTDNFGLEDIILEGISGDIDLASTRSDRGFGKFLPLKLLIMALIEGNQTDLSNENVEELTNKVFRLVSGKDGRGNKNLDDEKILKKIGQKIFHEIYGFELEHGFTNPSPRKVKLRPCVKAAYDELSKLGEVKFKKTEESRDSDYRRLERKFKRNIGYYLAISGLDAESEYLDDFKAHCLHLRQLGVKTSFRFLEKKLNNF